MLRPPSLPESRPGVPWRADRPLDRGRARAALVAAWPALGSEPVRYLGSGWDHDAYSVGTHRVALFPRRRGEVARMRRAAAVLRRVAPALRRAGLRAPALLGMGRPAAGFPYPFLLVARVPGVMAHQAALPLRDEAGLAADLGAALSALHTVVPPVGLPVKLAALPGQAAFVAREAERVARILPADAARAAAPWLQGRAPLPPACAGPGVLVHDDLGSEHLVLDPVTGRLSGIVDFGDAARGDPALDLAPLGAFFGWSFAARVRRHYTARTESGLEARTVALARARALLWLGENVLFDDRATRPRMRAAAVRAFAPADVFLAARRAP